MKIESYMLVYIVLNMNRDKFFRCCYFWVFESVIVEVKGCVKSGDIVEVFDVNGDWLGCGVFLFDL